MISSCEQTSTGKEDERKLDHVRITVVGEHR